MSCLCPTPSPSPACQYDANINVGPNIVMFFGSHITSGKCTSDPQYIEGIWTHDAEDRAICEQRAGVGNFKEEPQTFIYSSQGEDFAIQYSARELVQAGILPDWDSPHREILGMTASVPYNEDNYSDFTIGMVSTYYPDETRIVIPFDTFVLTEQELLMTGSYEAWTEYCFSRQECLIGEPYYDDYNKTMQTVPFGVLAARAIGFSPDAMFKSAVQAIENTNKHSDTTGVGIVINSLVKGVNSLLAPWFVSQGGLDEQEAWARQKFLRTERYMQCYEWIKGIYDQFYGKQYLVKIGNTPQSSSSPFRGVCVKDDMGNTPSSYPIIVRGDGFGQNLFLSDQVSSEGGYLNRYSSDLLGLNFGADLEYVKTDDGRINAFVKFGTVRYKTSASDSEWTSRIINKFGQNYIVDFSSMLSSNYFITTQQTFSSGSTGLKEVLYIKANMSHDIYLTADGQWVLMTLPEVVPIMPARSGDFIAGVNVFFDQISWHPKKPRTTQIPGGTLSNTSQFNLFKAQPMTYSLAGAVIPMKSNIFSYGPYFFDHAVGDAGGTEYIQDNFLCPWNYETVADHETLDPQSAYDTMDCIGKFLARENTKSLQYQEKGTITVASLPLFGIGENINVSPRPSGVVGPTLLTDMSVSYGTNGFTTTYNFESYTQRFGKQENFIKEAWNDSIKRSSETNSYLRDQRSRVSGMYSSLNKKILDKEKITTGTAFKKLTPAAKYDHSPARLLLSGYIMNNDVDFEGNTAHKYDPQKYIDYTLGVGTGTLNKVEVSSVPKSSSNPLGLPCGVEYGYLPCIQNASPIICSSEVPFFQFPYPSSINGTPCPTVCPSSSPKPSSSPPPSTSPVASHNYFSPAPSTSGNINRLYTFAEQHEAYEIEHIQDTYKQLAVMSLDGLFLPVSLLGDGAGNDGIINASGRPSGYSTPDNTVNLYRVPRFARYSNLKDSKTKDIYPITGQTKTRDAIPPFIYRSKSTGQPGGALTFGPGGWGFDTTKPQTNDRMAYAVAINQTFLNPMLSSALLIDRVFNQGLDNPSGYPIGPVGWNDIPKPITNPPLNNIPPGFGLGSGYVTPSECPLGGRANGSSRGFVITTIAYGNSFDDHNTNISDSEERAKQNSVNFRFSALRGPLVLQGWGYDTEGKPIPNQADNPIETERGVFKRGNLSDKFMRDWVDNPRTWPVGPVDLRFDRERGVWTAPPPNKIIVARLKEDLILGGVAPAHLVDPSAGLVPGVNYWSNYNITSPHGEDIKSDLFHTEILIYDYVGRPMSKGTVVYAYLVDSELSIDGKGNARYIALSGGSSGYSTNRLSDTVNSLSTDYGGSSNISTVSASSCPTVIDKCWVGLEVLTRIDNFDSGRTQALIHKKVSGGCCTTEGMCLSWMNIDPCPSTSP